jgi:hypothetical protein
MNSAILKTIVMKDRVLFGPDLYCATELFNNSDVVTVKPNGYIYEFEVKVSRSDLKGELDAMEYWLSEDAINPFFETPEDRQLSIVDFVVGETKRANHKLAKRMLRSEKWKKHYSYLVAEDKRYKRPRVFYFVVPPDLEEYALKRLEDSPYGLYVAQQVRGTHGGYMYNKKKAKPISVNKMDDRDRNEIMQRIQTENIMLKIERHLKEKA